MAFSAFGTQTDHFSLATEGIIVLVDASDKIPRPLNRADAPDTLGDLAAMTHFGQPTSNIYDLSATYELQSSTLDIATIIMGYQSATIARLSLSVTTSNGAWPRITLTGVENAIGIIAGATWTPNSFTLNGIKQAQVMGFTVTAGAELVGSGYEFAVTLDETTNGLGEPTAHSLSGNSPAKGTGSFVAITTTPEWTVTTGTETQVPGISEPQAAYGTADGAWEALIARDVAT